MNASEEEYGGMNVVKLKHFPIDTEHSFVQYTSRMTEARFKELVHGDPQM